jgi:hypothetical protein
VQQVRTREFSLDGHPIGGPSVREVLSGFIGRPKRTRPDTLRTASTILSRQTLPVHARDAEYWRSRNDQSGISVVPVSHAPARRTGTGGSPV